ncbi:malto-oligosyltrehalose trehalohydrolase [Subtercola boreus]|uniref:Malto-oligosyltrehalose trehalohydrolase n=1 Tax=Subtercola boreus TaxID=120213 RepID=A0A3E0WC16_9MICO|nr:malto-oligosyltrehalose trehalohydrolase [Subtercola boreus]RFA22086.1 malto-oligosyltrehalose trehalohydrolase [Subtercola boreus]RFA22266.1 malto-oligosyltrehalose trehalohydrolase [Subtercola boreus]RFA28129.1 malto-oligosyltrehalose trehalohydrolase [Subtercola boreus]
MTIKQFDVWAPRAQAVTLRLRELGAAGDKVDLGAAAAAASADPETTDVDAAGESATTDALRSITMEPSDDGWWTAPGLAGFIEADYGYVVTPLEGDPSDDDGDSYADAGAEGPIYSSVPTHIEDEQVLPDPRSRRQPSGVHGLSRSYDPTTFVWSDETWKGRQLAGGEIYELHLGTFTPQGTLEAAIGKLDHLVSIGVDFVELLPVNAFNGTHNWGYDGVLWFAVHELYGGPEGYQRFVDACHARGLGVIQDVVYNHLGPSGNYLPLYGPYLNDAAANTWGSAINLDGDDSAEVRRYIIDNALMWLNDYHVDGLRLDAVHALQDSSPVHLLAQLSTEVDALSSFLGKPLTLIAESDLNDPVMFTPRESHGYGLTGQWSDDFHHAVHVALTRETTGYYEDFDSLSALGKVLTEGFFHNGTFSTFREKTHGKPIDTAHVSTWRLVVANQNHDQIGNRATGDRLTASLTDGQLAIAAVLTLLGPFTPMLFMGEEWAASTPWQFFTSHPEPELGEATAKGRIAEFAKMGWDENEVPDPQDPSTFTNSKLDWSETESGRHTKLLRLYRDLATLRHGLPEFTDPRFTEVAVRFDEQARWFEVRRGDIRVLINFSEAPVDASMIDDALGEVLLSTQDVLADVDAGASGAGAGAPGTLPAHSATVYRRA